MSLDIF